MPGADHPQRITVRQSTDDGATTITVERDGIPVFGVAAESDGTMTAGYWPDDETWVPLLRTALPTT